ncbi:hypothetical protein [Chitinimonas sp. JJ19]|uniref:hypothetical protein n=1 Tax=Chitinimonas sp. JJ19 TaxID=3109352 RepID=UPI001A591603|nr:hypothetical protein [Chitinimonas sp.]
MQQSGLGNALGRLREDDTPPTVTDETRPFDADERTPAVLGEQLACRRAALGVGAL